MKFKDMNNSVPVINIHTEYKGVPIFIESNLHETESYFLNKDGYPGVANFFYDPFEGKFDTVHEQYTECNNSKENQQFVDRMPLTQQEKEGVMCWLSSCENYYQHNAFIQMLKEYNIQYRAERFDTGYKASHVIISFITKDTDTKNESENESILRDEINRAYHVISANVMLGRVAGKTTNFCYEERIDEHSTVVEEAVAIIDRQMKPLSGKNSRIITIARKNNEGEVGMLYAKNKKESDAIIGQIEKCFPDTYSVTEALNENTRKGNDSKSR